MLLNSDMNADFFNQRMSIIVDTSMSVVSATATETTSLAEGGDRVKFKTVWKGDICDFLALHNFSYTAYLGFVTDLAKALRIFESSGAAPVLPDGKIGGNAAVKVCRDELDFLIVSKSGKSAGQVIDIESDFCIVSSFNITEWSADFYSRCQSMLPTSDTPLHYTALHAGSRFNWSENPEVSLHGHAIQTEEDAARLKLPCSATETLFSTPDDTRELVHLMGCHAYPQHKIYVRKGHGFLILGKTVTDALDIFEKRILPFF